MCDISEKRRPDIGRRQRNKLDKQRRIVAAARELFHRKGFENTTTQEVADLAGVGAGTLFLYVSTKEDLLILAFVDEMVEVAERAYAALDPTAPFPEQVCQFLYSLLDYHQADVPLSKYLLREVSVIRNPERGWDLGRLPIASLLDAVVRTAQASGEIRCDVLPRAVGALMFASYWDCLRQWINGQINMTEARATLMGMIRLQISGLGAASSAPPSPRALRSRKLEAVQSP